MSLLSFLTGKPKLKPGEVAYEDYDNGAYVIKVRASQDATPAFQDRRIGPMFTDQGEAFKFADWLNGGPQYHYPTGKV